MTTATIATTLATATAHAQPPVDAVPMSVTGRAVLTYLDEFETGNSQLRYAIEQQQSNRRFSLNFEGEPPPGLRSGQPITVNGRGKGRNIYLAADGLQSSNGPAALTGVATGEQSTLVMVADFADTAVSCSVPEVQALMFTDPNNRSVDDLYREMSYGNVSLAGDVTGPYEISATSDGCDLEDWADEADAAALSAGYDPGSYSRRLYVMPQNSCPASGVADLGGDNSRAWVFRCSIADIYAHELGHNIGMHHAATAQAQYGDTTDVMGIGLGKLRHVNGPHKEQMGWLSDFDIQLIDAAGIYDIAPLELDAASALAPRLLKIQLPDTGEYLYLSYRRGIGFDTSLSSSSQLDRLSVHRYPGDYSASLTYLLGLPTDGESYSDVTNGITVTQLSHNNDYVTAEISLGNSPTCSRFAPSVQVLPGSQSAAAGASASFDVRVTNRDTVACSNSTFALAPAVPAGWSGSISPGSLNIAPGQTLSTMISVTSSAGAGPGAYNLSVAATDASVALHTASGAATLEIIDAGDEGDSPGRDTEAPSMPTGLSTNVKPNQVGLSWTASSDNVAVAGYDVYRDGARIATLTDTSYSDKNTASGVTYTYSVAAFDAAGNVSPQSAAAVAAVASGNGGGGNGGGGNGNGNGNGNSPRANAVESTDSGGGGSIDAWFLLALMGAVGIQRRKRFGVRMGSKAA